MFGLSNYKPTIVAVKSNHTYTMIRGCQINHVRLVSTCLFPTLEDERHPAAETSRFVGCRQWDV